MLVCLFLLSHSFIFSYALLFSHHIDLACYRGKIYLDAIGDYIPEDNGHDGYPEETIEQRTTRILNKHISVNEGISSRLFYV